MLKFLNKKIQVVLIVFVLVSRLFAQPYNSAKEYIDKISEYKKEINELEIKKDTDAKNNESKLKQELAKKISDVNSVPYENREKKIWSPGQFQDKKDEKIAKLKKEYETKINDEKKNIETSIDAEITNRKNEISGLENQLLQRKFTLSGNDVQVSIGDFDNEAADRGDRQSWPYTITSRSIDLSYTKNGKLYFSSEDELSQEKEFEKIEAHKNEYKGEITYVIEKSNDSEFKKKITNIKILDSTGTGRVVLLHALRLFVCNRCLGKDV